MVERSFKINIYAFINHKCNKFANVKSQFSNYEKYEKHKTICLSNIIYIRKFELHRPILAN